MRNNNNNNNNNSNNNNNNNNSNNNNDNSNNNNNNNNNNKTCQKWLLGGVLQKTFLKITKNSLKNTSARVPLPVPHYNTIKGLQTVRLATSLKKNPRSGVLEPAVRKCSLK